MLSCFPSFPSFPSFLPFPSVPLSSPSLSLRYLFLSLLIVLQDSGLPDFRGPNGFWRVYPFHESEKQREKKRRRGRIEKKRKGETKKVTKRKREERYSLMNSDILLYRNSVFDLKKWLIPFGFTKTHTWHGMSTYSPCQLSNIN